MMEQIIAWWFIKADDIETQRVFGTAVLQRLNFSTKVKVLRTLIERDEAAKAVLRKVDEANALRNAVAHRRIVFLDDDKKLFRFDPETSGGPMTISQLRGKLRDLEQLPAALASAVVPLMAEQSNTFRPDCVRQQ